MTPGLLNGVSRLLGEQVHQFFRRGVEDGHPFVEKVHIGAVEGFDVHGAAILSTVVDVQAGVVIGVGFIFRIMPRMMGPTPKKGSISKQRITRPLFVSDFQLDFI